MTIDNSGLLVADGVIFAEKENSWTTPASFTLPGKIGVVVIEAKNVGSVGAILASFSNGVVTDESWECTNDNSKNTSNWPKAVTYGNNNGTAVPWAKNLGWRGIHNINENAQWIWSKDSHDQRVVCRKPFGKCNE